MVIFGLEYSCLETGEGTLTGTHLEHSSHSLLCLNFIVGCGYLCKLDWNDDEYIY